MDRSVIYGDQVGAIQWRSLDGADRGGPPAGLLEPKCAGEISTEQESPRKGGDPLGVRESWVRTRNMIHRYAVNRKASKEIQNSSGKGLRDQSMARIRDKMKQLWEDLNKRLREGNREEKDGVIGVSQLGDPPDHGGDPETGRQEIIVFQISDQVT